MAVTLPVVNGSTGTWGTILNDAITDIDTRVGTAASDAASAATAAAAAAKATDLTALASRVTTLENAPSGGGGTGAGGLTVVNGALPAATVGAIVLNTATGFVSYGASIGGTATWVPFPGSYVAKLKRVTAQTFGNNSFGAVQFNAADFDRLNAWSSSTNPTRFTATIPGAYEFTGAISFAANATGVRGVYWYKNGVAQNGTSAIGNPASAGSTSINARTVIMALAANDYVELYGMQSSGVSLNTDAQTDLQPAMYVKYLGYNA